MISWMNHCRWSEIHCPTYNDNMVNENHARSEKHYYKEILTYQKGRQWQRWSALDCTYQRAMAKSCNLKRWTWSSGRRHTSLKSHPLPTNIATNLKWESIGVCSSTWWWVVGKNIFLWKSWKRATRNRCSLLTTSIEMWSNLIVYL